MENVFGNPPSGTESEKYVYIRKSFTHHVPFRLLSEVFRHSEWQIIFKSEHKKTQITYANLRELRENQQTYEHELENDS